MNTELKYAFRILALSNGVFFKIPFSLRGEMPTCNHVERLLSIDSV